MLAQAYVSVGNRLRRVNTWTAAVALLTLAGAILRLFHLGQQSLWYDEGYSVYLAAMTLRDATLWTARDVVPPLYYHILHFWQGVFSDSEAAVRSFSALVGTLTIPLVYAVGKELFGRPHGFVAGALVAVSPLYIWYSQEARTYMLLTFLGLLAAYFLLRVLSDGNNRRRRFGWVGFLIAATGTSYAHTTGLLLLSFLGLAFVVGWAGWIRRRAMLGEAAAVALAFVALQMPWIPLAVKNLGVNRGFWEGVLGIQGVIRQVFLSYWTGRTMFSETEDALLPGFVAVFVLSAVALIAACARRNEACAESSLPRWYAISFAALYSVFPVALYIVLFWRMPKFDTRYLFLASPGAFLLVGAGLTALLMWKVWAKWAARALGIAALLFLLGVFAYSDYNNHFDPRFQRDDFRNVARYIKERIGPNETVILCSGHFFPVFQYYFGPDNWHPLPDEPILDVERVLNFQVGDDLNRILKGKDGVWVVFWQDGVVDPNSILTMMLNEEGSRLPSGPQFWGVRYVHWRLNKDVEFSTVPQIQNPQRLNFGNRLELLGFSEGVSDYLLLYWQALQLLDRNYSVSLRLLDADGEFWGALDRRPAGYYFPTSRWRVGEPVFGFNLVPALTGTPPGEYWLEVVVYDEKTDNALDVLDVAGAPQGRSGRIGPVRLRLVQPETPADPLPVSSLLRISESVEVVAWHGDRTESSPGDVVSVVAYWQMNRSAEVDYSAEVVVLAEDGRVIATEAALLGSPVYRTTSWPSGVPVRWIVRLRVPAAASDGSYRLAIGLRNGMTGEAIGEGAPITSLSVKGYARIFEPPEFSMAFGANFGGLAELCGADVSATELRPGDEIRVVLYWLAQAEFATSYTVFLQVIGEENRIWAQRDYLPKDWTRPTTSWLPGEYIMDESILTLSPDIPAGSYRLIAGLYDASNPAFPRLPVLDAQGGAISDYVVLATIEIR
jgi:4-amino-4-deoxy-L-arabinose transferase-like glycosyltransferase